MENNETEPSVLDAVNEALGFEDADEPKTEIEETETDDGSAGEGDESSDEEGEEGDEGEGDEGGTEEERAAAAKAKSEFNEDGTRKKPETKKSDPVNDPLPKDLKKETSERMQSLIKTVKDKDVELTQVRGDFDTIVNGIKASGASPEQYGETISWLSLFNSPEPQSRMKAYELIEDVADRMATMLGIDRNVTDPLKDHADLKAAVAANQTTLAFAKEIARTRNAARFNTQINDNQRQQQQTQQQAQQEESQARAALTAFEVEMKAKDPLYEQKRAQIVPILRPVFKTLPKAQWPAAFQQAYANARVVPRGRPPGKPAQQPMRGGKQPAGGQTRQATSMMEAINGALASMPGTK